MTFIYALKCPETCAVRYIGKSDEPVARLRSHITSARGGKSLHRTAIWIRQLLERGLIPVLEVLHEVPAEGSWQAAEKKAIAEARAAGCDLTNSTSGGQGLCFLRDEDRQALRESLSKAWSREGAREQRRAGLTAACSKDETRERRVAAAAVADTKTRRLAGFQELYADANALERRRANQKLASNRPEVKAAKAAASSARWADPGYQARMRKKQAAAWVNRRKRS